MFGISLDAIHSCMKDKKLFDKSIVEGSREFGGLKRENE
jgi:hypothetical protein